MADLAGVVVLQVLPSLEIGGVERGTVEMVQAIRRAGGVPLVASAGGRMVGLVAHAGGEHITLPLASKNPLTMLANAGRLAWLIRRRGVRIVHARSRAPAWSAYWAVRRSGIGFVTTYHGPYGENAPFKRRYNSVMARGDRVIAISEFIHDHVLARHPVDPARLRTIPRGVDPCLFSPDLVTGPRIARLADRWQLPLDRKIVMLPGRLTAWKGQAVLIDALARLRDASAIAVLVGSDQGRHDYVAGLLRQAAQCGVADRLRLAGSCDDMPAALMLADVVVVPSTEPEAFGRAVVEAQAMGRPVVASNHGAAIETIVDGQTGWLVPPGDAGALAAAIDPLLAASAEDRALFGADLRAQVVARFSTAAMQAATLKVYRELLDRRP